MKSLLTMTFVCLTLLAGCKSGGGSDDSAGGGTGGDGSAPGPAQPVTPENTANAACEFGIDDISSNASRTFDCILDLEGGTFDVASGASLEFDKGDIRNGTLNFRGGTIDGRLMNSSLTLTGNPQLENEVFDFFPERWGIRQGRVSDAVALTNRDIFESTMSQTKRMGMKFFRINRMNAYFNVTPVPDDNNFQPEEEAINLPVSFTLQMTDDTHLRVQPNGHRSYALLAAVNTYSNFIRGGNLYGDRAQHRYSAGSTHEWGYLIHLFGVQAVHVVNVTLQDATGDAIKVQNTVGGRNMSFLQARENTFRNNRRNHISITSLQAPNIANNIIANNTFTNASTGTGPSAGVGPGFAIDLSASRTRGTDGEFIERVNNITIRNNTESNSRGGSFSVTHAENIQIHNNNVASGMSYQWAKGVTIRDNEITKTPSNSGIGIQVGQSDAADDSVEENVVRNNTISGFGTGMRIEGHKVIVRANTIIEATRGIVLDQLSDADILDTNITSERPSSVGVLAENTVLDDVAVDGSTVLVESYPLRLSQVNIASGQTNNDLTVSSSRLRSDTISLLDRVAGLDFNQNQLTSGLELRSVRDTSLAGTNIRTEGENGIHLKQQNTGIRITDSRIYVGSNDECIVIDASTSAGQVTQSGNECNKEVVYPRPGIPITEIPYAEIPDRTYTIDVAGQNISTNGQNPIETNQKLQAEIDKASAEGFGIVRFPAGRFMIGELGNSIYYSGLELHSNTAYLLDPNTIIEMTTNDKWNYCLLDAGGKQNVVISGGQLVGDRDTHIFTPRERDGKIAHDEGHLICLQGSETKNITIHSTVMRDATGDGVLMTGGLAASSQPGSVDNVVIINNDIGYNRRQGISLVGATNVLIEDNEIHHINGTAPQFGIDFEGPRRTNAKAMIRNNYFHHNRGGDIVNTDGLEVIVENNILEQGAGSEYIDGPLVYWKKGDITIRYNEITMTSESENNWNGIINYSSNTPKTNTATSYVYENVCNGCGMYMYYGRDLEIRDNILYNGHIALKDFRNVTITGNRVIGRRTGCWPYRFLRVRGQASGNILDNNAYNIPLVANADYTDCWI